MNTNDYKPNWFVRSLIIALGLLLASIILASFILVLPHYRITAGIITLLAMMIILALAESFHNFSLGKILTLSRNIERVESEKSEAKRENLELRQSLIQVATHIQSQVNTTIQTQGADLLQLLGVVKAPKEEKEEEDKQEAAEIPARPASVSSYRLLPHVETLALAKYTAKYGLSSPDIVRDIRFTEAFECIDPISNRPVTYDGYLKTPQKEYFIEVKTQRNMMGNVMWDRLYVMLSKVLLYKKTKNVQAELVLIIAKLPEQSDSRPTYPTDRLISWYQPAIAEGILRIETVDVSREEYQQIETEARKQMNE